MFQELDTVVLKRDDSSNSLQSGDIGAIVHCHVDQWTYEVEFVTADGSTIAVATLSEDDIRPMNENEILHVRAVRTVA